MRLDPQADGSFVTTPYFAGFAFAGRPPDPCPETHQWKADGEPVETPPEFGGWVKDMLMVDETCSTCNYRRTHFLPKESK